VLSRSFFFACFALTLNACPAPEPEAPTKQVAPVGPTDADAKAAMEKALEVKSSDALIEVFHKYPKLPSGKESLRRAARMMLVEVKDSAKACNEAAAKGTLARIAPFTLEDPEINEAYDEMQRQIGDNHARCLLAQLDADVKKAEEAWDWPGVFNAISAVKELDGATLKQRRLAAVARWKTWLDATVRGVVSGKITLDDKKAQALEASATEEQMPAELSDDVKKWAPTVHAAVVVFHDLEGGQMIDPVRKYTVSALAAPAKTRFIANPSATDGPTFAGGASFTAIARGKIDGVSVLVSGDGKPDPLARLATAKLVFEEWDTAGYKGPQKPKPPKPEAKKPEPKKPEPKKAEPKEEMLE
jgi:hypothetical protein